MKVLPAKRYRTSDIARSELVALLNCPACDHAELAVSPPADDLECQHCQATFPVYSSGHAGIPWLFPDPHSTLLEWKARYNGFLQSNLSEQFRLNTALEDGDLGQSGRDRIAQVLRHKETQRVHVLELLEPLGLDGDQASDAVPSLRSKLPKSQGLSSYYNNVFRDWAWDNGENEELLGAVRGALDAADRDRIGKILTIGAGSCRLPYDLHRAYAPDLSVALDINPLLMFIGSRVIQGESVPFCEFPIAPLNQASFAVRHDCRAPQPIEAFKGRFEFLFADGLNPPFKPGCFDTVLTPWLIDIIPEDLREFIPRVNRVLKKGGVWVNTGSLAFFHRDVTWHYSEEEVVELIESMGFEMLSAERTRIRYLHSPYSAHGRLENVFTFSARKVKSVTSPPRYEYLPQWITDPAQPIPDLFEFSIASSNHLLHAQVLAAINGQRTLDEIAALVAKQYGLQQDEASNAVQRILIELYEDK